MLSRPVSQGERAPLTRAPVSLGGAASGAGLGAQVAFTTPLADRRTTQVVGAPTNRAITVRDAALAPGTASGTRFGASPRLPLPEAMRRTIDLPDYDERNRQFIEKNDIVTRRLPNPELFVGGPSPFDFEQAYGGDCWVLSSMGALAVAEPQLFEDAIRDNGDGTYSVRLYKDGQPVEVAVDDRFYMLAALRKPIYARPRGDSQELWPLLMEKAFASLVGNGYGGIYGGFPIDAFRTLTGRESDVSIHEATTDEALFDAVASAIKNKRAAVTFTVNDTPDEQLKRAGLQVTHAYAVIGTMVEGTDRYVVLRNTSDRPEMRTDKYDAEYKEPNLPPGYIPDGLDGAFRVRIDDYRKLFYSTTIVKPAH